MADRAIPYVPPGGTRVDWPDAFGTRFTVFVDVEEEFDWSAPWRAGRTVHRR